MQGNCSLLNIDEKGHQVRKFLENNIDKKKYPFLEFVQTDSDMDESILKQEDIKGLFYRGCSDEGARLAECAGKQMKPAIV